MDNRKMILFFVSILLIVAVFSIPFYKNWLSVKFGSDLEIAGEQLEHMTIEERRLVRFGQTLLFLDKVKGYLEKYGNDNAMILLPPKAYVTASKVEEDKVDMPEPAVFYYFTGYQAVTPASPDVSRANWVIMSANHHLVIYHINSRVMLDSALRAFKPYL